MMQQPRRVASRQAAAERFGSRLTCGFVAPKLDDMASRRGARDVFVVKDMSRRAFATESHRETEVIERAELLSGDRVWEHS
eukprot:10412692-Alexandrium_andersonii.AAC.1